MGQTETLELLKKLKNWTKVRRLHEISNISQSSIGRSLKKLFEQGEVLKKIKRENGRRINFWRCK